MYGRVRRGLYRLIRGRWGDEMDREGDRIGRFFEAMYRLGFYYDPSSNVAR